MVLSERASATMCGINLRGHSRQRDERILAACAMGVALTQQRRPPSLPAQTRSCHADGHLEMVELLVTTKVDIDHVNHLGWTALLEAIVLSDGGPRHQQIVQVLVDAGADVNIADKEGIIPLQHARQKGFQEIVKILASAGAK